VYKPKTVEKCLCLDANYQQGKTGASADGYGYYDPEMNKKIYQTAYRASKVAVRYAKLYDSAQDMFLELPQLFQHIKEAIVYGSLNPQEVSESSCFLTRVFPSKNGKSTVVIAGVGDGMVVSWEPGDKKLTTILKPRCYNQGAKSQFTPVSITHKLSGDMLQMDMVDLEEGSVLIRMTDGAWRMLPHSSCKKILEGDKQYMEYTLDSQILQQGLIQFLSQKPNAGAVEYRQWFQDYIERSVQTHKLLLLSQHSTIKEKRRAFCEENENHRLGEFLEWAKDDAPFYDMLMSFLNSRDVMMDGIENIPLSTFDFELSKVTLGDDLMLHVQII